MAGTLVAVGAARRLPKDASASSLFREVATTQHDSSATISVFNASEKTMKDLAKKFKAWAGKYSERHLTKYICSLISGSVRPSAPVISPVISPVLSIIKSN